MADKIRQYLEENARQAKAIDRLRIFYRDNLGEVKGPFTEQQVQKWYEMKIYRNDSMFYTTEDGETAEELRTTHFYPLGNLISLNGAAAPFRSEGIWENMLKAFHKNESLLPTAGIPAAAESVGSGVAASVAAKESNKPASADSHVSASPGLNASAKIKGRSSAAAKTETKASPSVTATSTTIAAPAAAATASAEAESLHGSSDSSAELRRLILENHLRSVKNERIFYKDKQGRVKGAYSEAQAQKLYEMKLFDNATQFYITHGAGKPNELTPYLSLERLISAFGVEDPFRIQAAPDLNKKSVDQLEQELATLQLRSQTVVDLSGNRAEGTRNAEGPTLDESYIRFFVKDPKGGRLGPYAEEEVRHLYETKLFNKRTPIYVSRVGETPLDAAQVYPIVNLISLNGRENPFRSKGGCDEMMKSFEQMKLENPSGAAAEVEDDPADYPPWLKFVVETAYDWTQFLRTGVDGVMEKMDRDPFRIAKLIGDSIGVLVQRADPDLRESFMKQLTILLKQKKYFTCVFCHFYTVNYKHIVIHLSDEVHLDIVTVEAPHFEAVSMWMQALTKRWADTWLEEEKGPLQAVYAKYNPRSINDPSLKPDDAFLLRFGEKYQHMWDDLPEDTPIHIQIERARYNLSRNSLALRMTREMNAHIGQSQTRCGMCNLVMGTRDEFYEHHRSYEHLKMGSALETISHIANFSLMDMMVDLDVE